MDNNRSATRVSSALSASVVVWAHISSIVRNKCASNARMPPKSTSCCRVSATSPQACAILSSTSKTSSEPPWPRSATAASSCSTTAATPETLAALCLHGLGLRGGVGELVDAVLSGLAIDSSETEDH
eukprot:CAMPEP_0115333130 /NCGR_PEP_ID=MMETSP0270-20121206/87208_1 /TAXON_ID=71861 /ORGANISM="Scrippsiella trochoidea, Strain CCMP3099" /LENGTH=126 /DNA_ID=CAMNT_0002754015 /DNA_START=96 /DNA_END=473 /DNA_ORIENTATION=+